MSGAGGMLGLGMTSSNAPTMSPSSTSTSTSTLTNQMPSSRTSQSQLSLNDLSSHSSDHHAHSLSHINLPNNCTVAIPTSSVDTKARIKAIRVTTEGRETTNAYFMKITKMIDYNWDMIPDVNLIAIHNRNPILAYVLNKNARLGTRTSLSSMTSPEVDRNSQIVRIFNYVSCDRGLAKGAFQYQIADLAFSMNSNEEDKDEAKLAIADKGGNVYIYDIKKTLGNDIVAERVFEIKGDAFQYDLIKLTWCPYIPADDEDDDDFEGDPRLKLALSCNGRIELFAIDVIQDNHNSKVIDRTSLKALAGSYQVIERAHDLPILSLSISNDLTALCSAGMDDRVKFYQIYLNGEQEETKMFHNWGPDYLQAGDHISAFFFLDDFDFLVKNTDQNFWGHALIGTKKGDVSVLDLKEWKCKQSIKLVLDDDQLLESQLNFQYKIDFNGHHLVATVGNHAFIIHIRFPHDKEDIDKDNDLNMGYKDEFDQLHPYMIKVTRFQVYNAPLRSFLVKRESSSSVSVYWITGKSLEKCDIDLNSIYIDTTYEMSIDEPLTKSVKPNISFDKLNNVQQSSLISGEEYGASMNTFGDQRSLNNGMSLENVSAVDSRMSSSSGTHLLTQTPIKNINEALAAFNLEASNLRPSQFETHLQSQSRGGQRPESPASKEIQQIFQPTSSYSNVMIPASSHSNQNQPSIPSSYEDTSFPNKFPSMFPNFSKDFVTEEQMNQLKEDLRKDIQESESRIVNVMERFEANLNAKISDHFEMGNKNNGINTLRLELEIKEMKKELKNAYKVRNEDYSRVIDKLVHKMMGEMNVVLNHGLTELMSKVEKEVKYVTGSLDMAVSQIILRLEERKEFRPIPASPIASSSNYAYNQQTPQMRIKK